MATFNVTGEVNKETVSIHLKTTDSTPFEFAQFIERTVNHFCKEVGEEKVDILGLIATIGLIEDSQQPQAPQPTEQNNGSIN